MIEIEQKYRLGERRQKDTELLLIQLGFTKSAALYQSDKIFLIKSDSFKTFTAGDPVIRIRTVNSKASLTFKRATGSNSMIEHEMTVSSAAAAEGMLLEIGYKPVVEVEKQRVEYKRDDITVAMDDVRGLGKFLEVEMVCDKGQEKNAIIQIAKIAKILGLDESDIEAKKYDQLVSALKK